MSLQRLVRLLLVVGVLMTLVGCAAQGELKSPDERDPWEGFNRGVFKFNTDLDKAIVRPVTKGYDTITPDFLQHRFSSFFHNLLYPRSIINLALTGRLGDSAVGVGRVAVNLTFGLLGFFDVASDMGIAEHQEDFGQTLAVWGWRDSRYLVLPFFGPSTVRDGIGQQGVDFIYYHPIVTLSKNVSTIAPIAIHLLEERASFLATDQALYEAYDPYVFMRDAYFQQREYLIYNGDPPEPDYDDFLDPE